GLEHAVHDLLGTWAFQPTDFTEGVQRQGATEDALVELHGGSSVAVEADVRVETRGHLNSFGRNERSAHRTYGRDGTHRLTPGAGRPRATRSSVAPASRHHLSSSPDRSSSLSRSGSLRPSMTAILPAVTVKAMTE